MQTKGGVLPMSIGQTIKFLRRKADLTQEELAAALRAFPASNQPLVGRSRASRRHTHQSSHRRTQKVPYIKNKAYQNNGHSCVLICPSPIIMLNRLVFNTYDMDIYANSRIFRTKQRNQYGNHRFHVFHTGKFKSGMTVFATR